ncbi:MAG: AAA family ATPase [Lentisphaeraceae bacterium]|nr:AAA family ATPase [Lentisphaeraceae bacterium]
MNRKVIRDISNWYSKPNRKPLVLRGARQVGKSTAVKMFASQNKKVLHEINLEKYPALTDVFKSMNVKLILRELQFISQKGSITAENSILFLDEIQCIPYAIKCLRYFYEELPELAVITAGSLLEFTLKSENFSMPVGRIEYLYMEPATFEEFLMARNREDLLELLNQFSIYEPFPDIAHDQLLQEFRLYLLIGGMPEAIQAFIDSQDVAESFKVQTSINETYRDDFGKYSSRTALPRVQRVFDYIPASLGEKLKYSNISGDEKAADLRSAVDLLAQAGLIRPFFHTKADGIPLKSTINKKVLKCYFLDCGLVNRICGVEYISNEEMLNAAWLNKGALAEQFIAQHLSSVLNTSEKFTGTYWLREGGKGNAEVDFLLQFNNNICPIEVKSGASGSLKSLLYFMYSKSLNDAVRFDLNKPSLQNIEHSLKTAEKNVTVKGRLLSLPIYAVLQLKRIYNELNA